MLGFAFSFSDLAQFGVDLHNFALQILNSFCVSHLSPPIRNYAARQSGHNQSAHRPHTAAMVRHGAATVRKNWNGYLAAAQLAQQTLVALMPVLPSAVPFRGYRPLMMFDFAPPRAAAAPSAARPAPPCRPRLPLSMQRLPRHQLRPDTCGKCLIEEMKNFVLLDSESFIRMLFLFTVLIPQPTISAI